MEPKEILEELIKRHSHRQQTLLLVDTTKEEESFLLFQSSSQYAILDGKIMHTKKQTRQKTTTALLEEARSILTFAMTHGKILVIRLGDAQVDFQSTFCDEAAIDNNNDLQLTNPRPPYQSWSYLPYGFMLEDGNRIGHSISPDTLLRRDDLKDIEAGFANKRHPDFHIILTTTIPRNHLHGMLFNGKYGLPGREEDYTIVSYPDEQVLTLLDNA